jgi:hypothetical protein
MLDLILKGYTFFDTHCTFSCTHFFQATGLAKNDQLRVLGKFCEQLKRVVIQSDACI